MPQDHFYRHWQHAAAAGLDEHLRRKIAEDFFGAGGYAGFSAGTTMNDAKDLNARIPKKPRKVQTILVHAVETADHKHANIMVLVPNAFGTQEPLLDGETGRPVDFFDDFGDPRRWTRNMGPEIKEAAVRAGKVCAALVRSRGVLA